MTRFRITRRCAVDDLNLSPEDAGREAQYLCAAHVAVRGFYTKRQGAPGEGENLLAVVPYGHVKTLHVGQARGATIYDPDEDVCWLLAYGETHAVGERRDSYNDFVRLSDRDELLPTPNDYEALQSVTAASLMDELRDHGTKLLTAATEKPGHEAVSSFELVSGDDARVAVSVELIIDNSGTAEQGWVAFVLPYGCPLGQAQLLDLVADLIPSHVEADDIYFAADVNGRPIAHNELALTWSHYAEAASDE